MNRDDFKEIANIRLEEAKILLCNKKYSGAYYLSGYVIECALKACIAKNNKANDFPDKNTVSNSYTHDLHQLIKTAGLRLNLDEMIENDSQFQNNWPIVRQWSEASRYDKIEEYRATAIYNAIVDSEGGVLQWISQYW